MPHSLRPNFHHIGSRVGLSELHEQFLAEQRFAARVSSATLRERSLSPLR